MKTAIVHDWLVGMRGGEKCLEVFCELFPEADLYTLIHISGSCSPTIEKMNIHTSFIQGLPLSSTKYRNYLPLFPFAIESFDLKNYDLVISSSHCVAKGIIPPPDALHICYIHTPMRYIWDMFNEYFSKERVGQWTRIFISSVATFLRLWDVSSAKRVDYFIANSRHVQNRIWKYYRRKAIILNPPVNTTFFRPGKEIEDYYLIVSSLVPYKKTDIAIKTFNELKRPLIIIGKGPEEKYLRKLVKFSGIKFLGYQDNETVKKYYQKCRALIFPGEEDFGIVPLEAMACGRPVIAYGRGGALETIIPPNRDLPPTGILFSEQTPQALAHAVEEFEKIEKEFNINFIRAHSEKFSRERFKKDFENLVKFLLKEKPLEDALCSENEVKSLKI